MNENSYTSDGFEVSSSSESAEEIKAALGTPKDEPKQPEQAPEKPETEAKADEAGDEPETAPEVKEEPKKKGTPIRPDAPRRNPIARVEQATHEASVAKQQRDEIWRRYEEAQAELAKLRGTAKPDDTPKPVIEGKPKVDDFESYDEYTEALTDWKIEQREKQAAEARQAAEYEKSVNDRVKTFQERIGQHLQSNPDFWEKVSPDVVQLRPLSTLTDAERQQASPLNALAEHFIRSEHGPALMMYFTEHPDEIQRVATLHPSTFWVELGRIEGRLNAASTATAPQSTASKARPPVRPVTGSPTTDSDEIDDDAPFELFVKKRNAQERASARSGR